MKLSISHSSPRIKGIARYLNGFDLERMAKAYVSKRAIITPKNQSLTPGDFLAICEYLRFDYQKALQSMEA
jgi:hypothetical protein